MLARVWPNPVVELNRAVAVGFADGPEAGLALDALDTEALPGYAPLAAVRGDLLAKLGRTQQAAAEFRRAAALTHNRPEQALYEARAAAVGQSPSAICESVHDGDGPR